MTREPIEQSEYTAPKVSIVVPCYNRAWYLDRLLESLTWSSTGFDEFEVLVCDDGGSDHAELTVERWRRRGMDVRQIAIRPAGSPRNGGFARNAGIRAARYPIVINTDPEMVFAADVISLSRAELHPGSYCSAGAVYALTKDSFLELLEKESLDILAGDSVLRFQKQRPNLADVPEGSRALHAAFAAWRDDLLAVRGYDESFTAWGCEDVDIAQRFESQLGLKRKPIGDLTVYHLWHPELRGGDGSFSGLLPDRTWKFYHQQSIVSHWPQRTVNAGGFGLDAAPSPAGSIADYHAAATAAREAARCSDMECTASRCIFASHLLEARELRNRGLHAAAASMIVYALSHAWEAEDVPLSLFVSGFDTLATQIDALGGQLCRETLTHDALREFCLAALAANEVAAVDAGLRHIDALGFAPAAADFDLRARILRAKGALASAAGMARTALGHDPAAEQYALAAECALDVQDFAVCAELSLAGLMAKPDAGIMQRLTLLAILDHAQRHGANLELTAGIAQERDILLHHPTEMHYSAAVRAWRAGFPAAAATLMTIFLENSLETEERLRREGSAYLCLAFRSLGETDRANKHYREMRRCGWLPQLPTWMNASLQVICDNSEEKNDELS